MCTLTAIAQEIPQQTGAEDFATTRSVFSGSTTKVLDGTANLCAHQTQCTFSFAAIVRGNERLIDQTAINETEWQQAEFSISGLSGAQSINAGDFSLQVFLYG